jgi:hypothetical protein
MEMRLILLLKKLIQFLLIPHQQVNFTFLLFLNCSHKERDSLLIPTRASEKKDYRLFYGKAHCSKKNKIKLK